jgi:hypothetical protein
MFALLGKSAGKKGFICIENQYRGPLSGHAPLASKHLDLLQENSLPKLFFVKTENNLK